MSPRARRTLLGWGLLLVVVIGVGPLAWAEKEPQPQDPKQQEDQQPKPVTTETLGGAQRYLTHVSTDKPIYRPGETLYVRGAVLAAADRVLELLRLEPRRGGDHDEVGPAVDGLLEAVESPEDPFRRHDDLVPVPGREQLQPPAQRR